MAKIEELRKLVKEKGQVQVGKLFGVSPRAVKKRLCRGEVPVA